MFHWLKSIKFIFKSAGHGVESVFQGITYAYRGAVGLATKRRRPKDSKGKVKGVKRDSEGRFVSTKGGVRKVR